MFVEIILAVFLGILIGTFTGVTPGIHVNLVALLCFSSAPFLLKYLDPLTVCTFIISVAVTHTFLDFVPSIFLGAPDESNIMSALPGHRYLLKGKAYMAVKLSVIGSLGALILCLLFFPLTLLLVKTIQPIIKDIIGWLLIFTMFYMILKDKKWHWNLAIFLLSGCLGIIVLNLPSLSDPLFPLLSGLFGLSTLIMSIYEKVNIPEQDISKTSLIKTKKAIKPIFLSTLAGFMTSFMPGLGPAQGAVLSTEISKDMDEDGFLILVGGIGTVNFVLSLSTLYMLEKSRNGAVVIISKFIESITLNQVLIFLCACLIAGGIAAIITLYTAKIFSKLIEKVNYQKLILCIICFIIILTLYFCSYLGLLVLLVSTSIGIMAAKTEIAKSHCMGCLILPVILFFIL